MIVADIKLLLADREDIVRRLDERVGDGADVLDRVPADSVVEDLNPRGSLGSCIWVGFRSAPIPREYSLVRNMVDGEDVDSLILCLLRIRYNINAVSDERPVEVLKCKSLGLPGLRIASAGPYIHSHVRPNAGFVKRLTSGSMM